MAQLPASSLLSGPSFSSLATDARGTDALRGLAARDPRAAVGEAARQFEALFTQELMKSMRQATMSSGLLDNEATRLGTEMLDSQLATRMTGLPGGLSEAIARQLERQMGLAPPARGEGQAAAGMPAARLPALRTPASTPPAAPTAAPTAAAAAATPPRVGPGGGHAHAFIANHQAAAERAEAATGIPATFMLAQAALESGWGRRQIRMPDGAPSHNLFGIKAGPGWDGAVTEVTTTEFIGGRAMKVKARFRAYESPEAAFADYARLMTTSRRYERVIAEAGSARGFAEGLQRAGYATDPQYAEKLGRVIDTAQRLQRGMA